VAAGEQGGEVAGALGGDGVVDLGVELVVVGGAVHGAEHADGGDAVVDVAEAGEHEGDGGFGVGGVVHEQGVGGGVGGVDDFEAAAAGEPDAFFVVGAEGDGLA